MPKIIKVTHDYIEQGTRVILRDTITHPIAGPQPIDTEVRLASIIEDRAALEAAVVAEVKKAQAKAPGDPALTLPELDIS